MVRRIVFFGNCQVKYLARTYIGQIAPLTGDVVTYLDVVHADLAAPRERSLVAAADIIVDQVFDTPDHLSNEMLHSRTKRIRVPNIRADFLWPFGTRELHPKSAEFEHIVRNYYAHEYGDTFLNRMLLRNVDPAEAVRRYMNVDFKKERNVDRILELSLDRQRRRDSISGLSLADTIEHNFRAKKLFTSPGHPTEDLLIILARFVFPQIEPGPNVEQALMGHSHAFLPWRLAPIHPGIIEHFGLKYIDRHFRFSTYDEGYVTFEQHAMRYMNGSAVVELRRVLDEGATLTPEETIELLECALNRVPCAPAAFRLKANALRKLRRANEARDSALKAVAIEPANPENCIELSNCYLSTGELLLAEEVARQTIARFPRVAGTFHALGDILHAKGDLPGAIEAVKHGVDIYPGSPFGLVKYSRFLAEGGDHSNAEHVGRKAALLAPKLESATIVWANALEKLGRRIEAIGAIKDLISRGNSSAGMYARLGRLLWEEGALEEAEVAVFEATRLDPLADNYAAMLAELRGDRKRREGDQIEGIAA